MNVLCSQLIGDLPRSLKRLFSIGTSEFWCTGRMLVQVERQSILIVDGEFLSNSSVVCTYLIMLQQKSLQDV